MKRKYIIGFIVGAWLIIAPWILGFTSIDLAFWNSVLAGAAVAVLVAWDIIYSREDHV